MKAQPGQPVRGGCDIFGRPLAPGSTLAGGHFYEAAKARGIMDRGMLLNAVLCDVADPGLRFWRRRFRDGTGAN